MLGPRNAAQGTSPSTCPSWHQAMKRGSDVALPARRPSHRQQPSSGPLSATTPSWGEYRRLARPVARDRARVRACNRNACVRIDGQGQLERAPRQRRDAMRRHRTEREAEQGHSRSRTCSDRHATGKATHLLRQWACDQATYLAQQSRPLRVTTRKRKPWQTPDAKR